MVDEQKFAVDSEHSELHFHLLQLLVEFPPHNTFTFFAEFKKTQNLVLDVEEETIPSFSHFVTEVSIWDGNFGLPLFP